LKNTKNDIKQRLFLVNALTREAGLTLLTTNGIILLCVSSNNLMAVARALGATRETLRYRVRKYNLKIVE
jgi:transcriptional regulator with GAF, ATPase, and Fis domain